MAQKPPSASATKPTNIKTASPGGTPLQSPRSKESSLQPSPAVSHRSSFADNLRNYPPSPRAQRTQSFSGQALTDLLMNPPPKHNGEEAKFRGRDWRTVQVGEIIDPSEVRFVELNTSIEDTTKLLIRSGAPNVVLMRESRKTRTAIGAFDYSDLNAYLLLVLGLSQPDEQAQQLADRARSGEAIPLSDLNDHLGAREEPAFLPHTADLTRAVEVLGGGSHRVVINKDGTSEAIGVLSQLRLVRFFWENHQNFTSTEQLYARSLKELELGGKHMLAINGDKPLSDALRLMHDEGITSIPILDSHQNVVGNISHVDVRLLTDTSSIPLLSQSCIHFISVILSERGLWDGKDSYPVFHVTPFSTLAHTVAKLCATRSHRMWIVDAPSPSTSVPPSPGIHATAPPFNSASTMHLTAPSAHLASPPRNAAGSELSSGPLHGSMGGGMSVNASQITGATMSGRLMGVVSLTDVLNLFARASGLSPGDPEEMRKRRRRSSSSSSRPNIDSMRASGEIIRGSTELGRSSSTSSRR
ncbi:cell separation during budding [Recurvomyces mirabilis]|nr:cell separation during budding [Recurvomyces mirabilis]